eukprot:2136764-Rhodomonas_salina.1
MAYGGAMRGTGRASGAVPGTDAAYGAVGHDGMSLILQKFPMRSPDSPMQCPLISYTVAPTFPHHPPTVPRIPYTTSATVQRSP